MKTFRVYEIEHSGDEQASIDELRAAGCTDIKVLSRDYSGSESMVVRCDLPPNKTLAQIEAGSEFLIL